MVHVETFCLAYGKFNLSFFVFSLSLICMVRTFYLERGLRDKLE